MHDRPSRHLSFLCGDVELTCWLVDTSIPPPEIGYSADWSTRHAALENLVGDHRACPGISWRESIGLTLRMPSTMRFLRNGWVEVTHRSGFHDTRVCRMRSTQKWDYLPGKSRDGDTEYDKARLFPRADLRMPRPRDMINPFQEMKLHLLGDVRVSSWSVRTGVISMQPLPKDYVSFLLPLPNHRYPPGYSVGQGITPAIQTRVHLAIPLDIHFDELPDDVDEVVIERGTPMVQWVVAKVPRVDVSYHPLRSHRYEENIPPDAAVELVASWQVESVLGQLERIAGGGEEWLRLPDKEGDEIELSLTAKEARVLLAAAETPLDLGRVQDAGLFEDVASARRVIGELVALGALDWSTELTHTDDARRRYRIDRYSAERYESVDAVGDAEYLVVVDDRNRECLWPVDRPVEAPWKAKGFRGPKLAALEHILHNWSDERAPMHIQRRKVALEGDGVTPYDELRFSPAHELKVGHGKTPEGSEMLILEYGEHEIEFFDPYLLPFAKHLVEKEHFVAGCTTAWSSGEPYPWETVEEMLNSFLATGILERVKKHG